MGLQAKEIESVLNTAPFRNRREAVGWQSVEAALDTTEGFDPVLADMVHMKYRPNYLIGIGFGRILDYTRAFYDENLKGVLCIDVSPKVVATGRLVRSIIEESKSPSDFVKLVQDERALRARANGIQPEEGISYAMSTLSRLFTTETQKKVRINSILPFKKSDLIDFIKNELFGRYSIPEMLLQNYDFFRKLTIEGRLGIVEADITNPNFLQGVKNSLRSYEISNVVVYVSNAIDEVTAYKKLPVCQNLHPANGILLLRDAATYGVMDEYNGEPVKYEISQADGMWKRSVMLRDRGRGSYIKVYAVGNVKPKVEVMYARSSDQLSDIDNPQRLENAKRSAIDFFQRTDSYAGFSGS